MDRPGRKAFEEAAAAVIRNNISPEAFAWLQQNGTQIKAEKSSVALNRAFAAVPRKTGRLAVASSAAENDYFESVHADFSLRGWTTDRLCRVWLLLQVDATDEKIYCEKIELLFQAAEMNELVALYAGLFFLAYPEAWQLRCAEGIRSNIGVVLEAIMYDNPYPCRYLNSQAWNQLVLKAFFTGKDVNRIIGLDDRANPELASVLVDYAHERWAAGRAVDPLLWRAVSKYMDAGNFGDIEKVFIHGSMAERKAAALACSGSGYEPAKRLLETDAALASAVRENTIGWSDVSSH